MTGTLITFLGLGNDTWSGGMRDFADRMRDQFGWRTGVFNHDQAAEAVKFAFDRPGPLVVNMHSKGASEGNRFASKLGRPIDLGFFVDAWLPLSAAPNFKRVVSVKAETLGRFHVSANGPVRHEQIAGTTHTTVDDAAALHELMQNEMIALLQPSGNPGFEFEENKPPRDWTDKQFDREAFFDAVRMSPFKGELSQDQVDGMELMLSTWEERFSHWHMGELAYNLATAYAETRVMQPIKEIGSRAYFNKYDIAHNPRKAEQLGNTVPGDGFKYRGEGLVQNTGKRNAKFASDRLNELYKLNVDLVANPDKRGDPIISVLSLFVGNHEGWWTGRRLPNYAGYGSWNMKQARTVVNGYDRWQEIGEYADAFLAALKIAARDISPQLPGNPSDPVIVPPANPGLPTGELTLEHLRKLDTAVLAHGMRQASDIIKLSTIVLEERSTGNSQPFPGAAITTRGNEIMEGEGKAAWQSSGVVGSILALYGVFAPMFGLDVVTPAEAAEVVNPIVASVGAVLSLIGRLKAKTPITRAI